MRALVGAVMAVLVLSSCAGSGEVGGDRRVVGDAQIAFTITPARVEIGKAVRFSLKVVNNGGRPEELRFATGRLYDFWVTRGDREIWRWSDDRSFTQQLTTRSVATQDTMTFTESWNASDAGEFIAHGLLEADGYEQPLTGRLEVRG